jgi:hypothetical protein
MLKVVCRANQFAAQTDRALYYSSRNGDFYFRFWILDFGLEHLKPKPRFVTNSFTQEWSE